jgi:hypothetical protein
MPEPVSILLCGRDALLLQTRQWVLEAAGHQVETTTKLSEVALVSIPVDLLILCHSLSLDECGRIFALASTRWPRIRCIILPEGASFCSEQMLRSVQDVIGNPEKPLPAAPAPPETYRKQFWKLLLSR